MPTEERAWGFGQVDQSADPMRLVQYLDAFGSQEQIRWIKHQSYQLLAISESMRLLDIGCGTGENIRALTQIVGPQGQVAGINSSSIMITEASQCSRGFPFPVISQQANCANLPFENAIFDGCRVERVFQHLTDPTQALKGLIHMTRPGESDAYFCGP